MKSIVLSFAAMCLLGLAQAGEEYIQTEVFATTTYHEFNTLDQYSRGGLIAGWIIYGIVVVFSFIMVAHATFERSHEYNKNLVEARNVMRRLGINVDDVDREFDEIQKGGQKVEEQVDLIQVALKEGEKFRSGGGRGAENRI